MNQQHSDQVAYMNQQRQAQMAADAFPYLMFMAVIDPSTHPSHAALNGVIWCKSDPVWEIIYPPYGTSCRCRTRALTEGQLKREKLIVSGSPEILKRNIEKSLGVDASSGEQHGLRFTNSAGVLVTIWLEK